MACEAVRMLLGRMHVQGSISATAINQQSGRRLLTTSRNYNCGTRAFMWRIFMLVKNFHVDYTLRFYTWLVYADCTRGLPAVFIYADYL